MINLPQTEFNQLPYLNFQNNLRIKDGIVYKLFGYDFYKREFINFLYTLKPIEGLLLPTDLFGEDDTVLGYTTSYIEPGITLQEYVGGTYLPFKPDIISIIMGLFETIEKAHNHFIFADVRNQNILLTPDRGIFIDADNGIRKNEDPSLAYTYHHIILNHFKLPESVLVDTIKTLICALSLYYNLELEYELFQVSNKEIHPLYTPRIIDLEVFLEIIKKFGVPEPFIEYLTILLNSAKIGKLDNVKRFAKIGKGLDNPTQDDTLKLKRFLSEVKY